MSAILKKLNKGLSRFIEAQQMFFVGTAPHEGRVNLSPKGLDSLRILSDTRVIWLNLTGSGNETAAHVLENQRMTIMFCAFEGSPLILRLYGKATFYQPGDNEWEELISHFPDYTGARQIFDLQVDTVQTSCGFAVPLYDYQGQRSRLPEWSAKKGREGIKTYWQEKNVRSMDGLETGMKSYNEKD